MVQILGDGLCSEESDFTVIVLDGEDPGYTLVAWSTGSQTARDSDSVGFAGMLVPGRKTHTTRTT